MAGLLVSCLSGQVSLPGVASTDNPLAESNYGKDIPGDFIDIPTGTATFDEFQLVISELDDLGLGVEFRHGFEVSE